MSIPPSTVLKEDRTQSVSPSEVLERWQWYFCEVSNVTSEYKSEMISGMPALPCLS